MNSRHLAVCCCRPATAAWAWHLGYGQQTTAGPLYHIVTPSCILLTCIVNLLLLPCLHVGVCVVHLQRVLHADWNLSWASYRQHTCCQLHCDAITSTVVKVACAYAAAVRVAHLCVLHCGQLSIMPSNFWHHCLGVLPATTLTKVFAVIL